VLDRLHERMSGTRIVLLVIVTLAVLREANAKDMEFAKYPGEAALVGRPAQPQMQLAKARRFRSVLRSAAAEGPNFNGHFRVVHWGCGTNCIEWAVIDLIDGRVWFAPEEASSCWAPEPEGLEWPEWIEVHVSSRLLYLHECSGDGKRDRTFDQRHVYVWRSNGPVILRTEPFRAKGDSAVK
jgi:hypothetical protein